jgi:hypothetical protein
VQHCCKARGLLPNIQACSPVVAASHCPTRPLEAGRQSKPIEIRQTARMLRCERL